MNSQQLLFINFLIVGALVLYFVLGRSKHKQKAVLDTKKLAEKTAERATDVPDDIEENVTVSDTTETKVQILDNEDVVAVKESKVEVHTEVKVTKKSQSKEIVFFVYNGHEWEAHEVLGLKSGVSLEEATRHYQSLIKTSDPSTFEFYEAAFSAILKLKSSKW